MATAAAVTPPTERFERLALDLIDPDPDQPRKTFDEHELRDLAASINAHGVVVPIKVRPNAKKAGRYMLVAGERRWRASRMAGETDIPAVIEDLDATAALEQQIIENSQRVDVPPLEEAEAYEALMKKHGYTMDKLIAKTGRSKAHLYGRLKLLALAPGARKALQSGKLAPAIAELVARIPDQKLQEQATKDVLGEGRDYGWDLRPEQVTAEGDDRPVAQPLSYRAAIALIRRRYQTQFDLLRFDPADKTLLPKVGACMDCPHRAGNQPGLPGLTPAKGLDDDHCTKPSCFEEKVEAAFKEKAELAKARGLKVIDGAAAKKILPYHSGDIAHDANYADPKSSLPYNIAKPGSNATWSGLLGKHAEELPRVFVQDPNTGAGRELLVKDKAIEKLRELGKIDKAERKSSSSSSADAEYKKDRAKQKAKRELAQASLTRFLDQVVAGAAKDPGAKELPLWRWLARGLALQLHYDAGELLVSRRAVKSPDELPELADELKTLGEVRGFVAEMLLCLIGDRLVDGYAGKEEKEQLARAEKIFGADWDKATAAAKEAAKAESKADAAKDAKKAPAKTAKKGKAK